MNDPHVVALLYRVNEETLEGYTGEVPLDHECDRFRITLDGSRVRFELKDHFATEAAAREVVDEFVAQWRLHAGVVGPYRDFWLRFDGSEIEDRDPEPNTVAIRAASRVRVSGTAELVVRHPALPSPPSGLEYTRDVESMVLRFQGHLKGREPLPSMAYFCLTVLEASVAVGVPKGRRRGTSRKYRISRGVLREIGCLAAEKGGRQARKASGTPSELTSRDAEFLLEAVRRLILRAAEVAYDPGGDYPNITLRDLPRTDAPPHP